MRTLLVRPMLFVLLVIGLACTSDDHASRREPGKAVNPLIVVEQTKLVPQHAAPFARFGWSVALSGDTALIGSSEAQNGADAGTAYAFIRSGNCWSQQFRFVPSDGVSSMQFFGHSLAVEGDRAVIAKPWDSHSGVVHAGSIYVFARTQSWDPEAKLTATVPATETLGFSVGLSGDTIVSGTQGGNAHVFVRSGGLWSEQAMLWPIDGDPGTLSFGQSVAISGDTLVASRPCEDTCGAGPGSAYVFVRDGGSWSQQAKLVASDATVADDFGGGEGRSVAIHGDTIVVGASSQERGGMPSVGAAYVFTRLGAVWTETSKLVASDGLAGDSFGYAVSIGAGRILVGAPGHGSGRAYLFVLNGSAWVEEAIIEPVDQAPPQQDFGWSVAIAGDTLLVGAPLDTYVGPQSGTASVFVDEESASDGCGGEAGSGGEPSQSSQGGAGAGVHVGGAEAGAGGSSTGSSTRSNVVADSGCGCRMENPPSPDSRLLIVIATLVLGLLRRSDARCRERAVPP